MVSNNLTFLILLLFFSYLFNKYFIFFAKKFHKSFLVDNEFNKPQAFHNKSTLRSGGVGIFFSFLLVFAYFIFLKKAIYLEYVYFCVVFFLIGFLDDLKIYFMPKLRLAMMFFAIIFLVILNDFYIEKTGIEFLNNLLQVDIFSLFFICLCFLFIINGANLIDGFNGLLGIHSLIIIVNLFFVNYFNANYDFAFFLLCAVIILISFLAFNFPKAKLFLGDSGSYFLGTFLSISAIKTSIDIPTISPCYFCILLFYLFFEVFFSFVRKLINKKSPLFPDKMHLHMLTYNFLYKKNKNKIKSNYYVSILINSIFLLLTTPAIFFMGNGLLCKYYSIIFFVIYLFSYKSVYKMDKGKI